MPPKKAAAAASKTKQVSSEKSAAKKKAPVKAALKAPEPVVTKTATKPATAANPKKRRADENEDEEPKVNGTIAKRAKKESTPATSKPVKKTAAASKRGASAAADETAIPTVKKARASPAPRGQKAKVAINTRPTQVYDVYLFGGGESGELGFAGVKGSKEIKRPRLNPYLSPDKAGVVQFAVGGMHTAALTRDNKILTWGVNDQGALGRDTTWDGGLADMKGSGDSGDSDSDSDEGEINPHESTPGQVDFPELGQQPEFTQVAASDSATFALTEEGLVYGWGTFRSNEGIFGFSEKTLIQERPILVPGLKNITKLAAGANHILALDKAGAVYAWGAGQQNQLGRRILERHQISSLTPAKFGLRGKFTNIGVGSFHSFAIKDNGDVYSWGLNSFGQTGLPVNTSEGGPDVHLPAKVKSLAPDADGHGKVILITAGSQHSIAVTSTGAALTWGRLDGHQVGIAFDKLSDDHLIRDANNRPRILTHPTAIPNIKGAATAAAGSAHSIVITKTGKAYGFGFNEYGQCGVGTTDDVKVAELIENTAVRDKMLVIADCGGQFSCIASAHGQARVNGVVNGADGSESSSA